MALFVFLIAFTANKIKIEVFVGTDKPSPQGKKFWVFISLWGNLVQ